MTTPDNPYRAPAAAVADIRESVAETRFGLPAATVDAGRGSTWIGEGWALFKAAPLMWIVAMLVLFGIQMLLGIVPVLGSIASLLIGPMFMVGVLAFGHAIAEGGEADLGNLFVGFKDKVGSLVLVAVLYFALIMAVIVICVIAAVVLLGGSQLLSAASPEAAMGQIIAGAGGLAFLGIFLLMFGLLVLVAASYWFAPGLVFYANLGAWDAMKASFSACLRNWLPFLVYGILAFLVMIGGLLALVIGFFVVAMPLLMASYYTSFRDIFGQQR
ncbi:MAG: hypothetical protein K0S46_2627 [Moraxellaceae bacterium]|jgi:uncharacterized membrane protein|nr:hypothetical protein [Moraxellaceae bacterium]